MRELPLKPAVKQHKKIRLLLCRSDTELMPERERLVVSVTTANRIVASVDMMNLVRNDMGSDRSNIEIKWHKDIPAMSLVILDPRSGSGLMQIEPYPYGTPQDDRMTFKISRNDHQTLFDIYYRAFERLWEEAAPAPLNNLR